MCFSPTMSGSFFVVGFILAIVTYVNPKIRKTYMFVPLAFYTMMELLQTIQYFYVNQCDSKVNKTLTEIAYVLVIVQPLLWNTVFYLRAKQAKHKSIHLLGMVMSAVWLVGNAYARVFYSPDKANDECGFFNHNKTCTYRDSKDSHLYWRWTTNHYRDFTANYFMYLCLWFLPALLVAENRLFGLIFAVGAAIGWGITKKYGSTDVEFPATWCYMSIPILVVGFIHYMLYGTI